MSSVELHNVWRQWRAQRVHCTPGLGSAHDGDWWRYWRERPVRKEGLNVLGKDALDSDGTNETKGTAEVGPEVFGEGGV